MSSPDRAVFRLPWISFLIPFLFFICITPLATTGPAAFLAFYLFPVLGLAYILLTRTVADGTTISTMGLLGPRRVAWSDLDGFEFRGPRWATAVALDGRRLRLPMVRPRDMPRLAFVSGGRLLLGKDAPKPAPDEPGSEPGSAAPETVQVQQGEPATGSPAVAEQAATVRTPTDDE